MKKIAIRFDIDTHKCIRDGVPALLELSQKYNVPFTFYLNLGKSVNIIESIIEIFIKKSNDRDSCIRGGMYSALYKLGIKDYIIAAILNPSICKYKKQIKLLLESESEIGIHGGKNHARWAKNALIWDEKEIGNQVDYAIKKIKGINPQYELNGFASPCWTSNKRIVNVLENKGFKYYADIHELNARQVVCNDDKLPCIITNLYGEPQGIAFFENCRALGMNDDEIIDKVLNSEAETLILYDHPYYAGCKEIKLLDKLLAKLIKNDIEVVKIQDLIY